MSSILKKYRSLPVQVRASFWFLICAFLQKGIQVITTPIITRLLTTSEFGQYSVFDSWLKILTIIITLQIYSGVYTQGLIKFSEDRKVFSSSLQGLTLSLTIVWTIIYFLFKDYWNKLFSLTTVQMLAMLVMIWATGAFHFWSSEQRVEYKYKSLVIATLIISFAKPVIGIIFILFANDKATAYILALALVELIGYTGFFVIQMNAGKVFYSSKYWKYAIAFNLPLVPHYLSQNVLNSADRIMINSMIGTSEAGIYSLAYSISLIMTLFNTALSQTMSPWIYQKIKDRKATEISNVAYLSLVLIAIANILLIAIAPEAVAFFAPKEYSEAIWVIPPVAMSVIFMYSYDLFAKFEFYFEKTKYIMMASVSGAILNIVLNYIFIKTFGYIAAAYTTLICYILYSVLHYCFMKKVCHDYMEDVIVYDPKKLLLIYLAFISSSFILMGTYNLPVIRYLLIGIVFIGLIIERKKLIQIINNMLLLRKEK